MTDYDRFGHERRRNRLAKEKEANEESDAEEAVTETWIWLLIGQLMLPASDAVLPSLFYFSIFLSSQYLIYFLARVAPLLLQST